MKGTVKIGSKEVGMVANAASPYIYKQIFHEDFLAKIQEKTPDADLFQKMGFVFAKQNEIEKISDLVKLTEEVYLEWLTGFEPLDILLATKEIADLYYRQRKGTAVPKSKGE